MTKRPWRVAWEAALYGESGFYRTARPIEHFRTSVHVERFADAIAELVRRSDSKTVVDLGAGSGELLIAMHSRLGNQVGLIGVEVSERPTKLPSEIGWSASLPAQIDGLLIANEWLDNIPCDVVEVDHAGVVREVVIDAQTGEEALGQALSSAWLTDWWPLREPGERAEIGGPRDEAWKDAISRVDGLAIAIDYGHTVESRPPFGSVRSYAHGQEVDVVPDGSRDITAHVAVDSVAAAVGAHLLSQRDALRLLGMDGSRPPLELAHTDPPAYVRALARAGQGAELLASMGLGDFWWIVTDTHGRGTLTA